MLLDVAKPEKAEGQVIHHLNDDQKSLIIRYGFNKADNDYRIEAYNNLRAISLHNLASICSML